MRKKDELSREHTCMQHAHPEEMVFVLLSRDAAAPVAIRAWVAERLRLGKNVEGDPQITEALECAKVMETEGRRWVKQDRATATVRLGDSLWHGGAGWYYVDDEYPEEGSCGPFNTRLEAVEHAEKSDYYVRNKVEV